MKNAVFISMLLVAALLFAQCSRDHGCEELPTIGCPAPNFKLSDLSGREVSLDQYRGRVVMLDFWATWCGPCRMTMPLLENLQKEYPNDLRLLAINLREPADMVRDYVRKQSISSEVLLDEKGEVGDTYRSDSIPMQVLIDKQGVVRHVTAGYSPRLASQLRSWIESLR